jgi:hypothetical protein
MPHNTNNTTSSIIDNYMQNSSTTMSWEVLYDDHQHPLHPNIELLRQLEQSMEFGNINDDDDDDDWSQPDDHNNKNDRRINPTSTTSNSVPQQPEQFSSLQTLWKVRFLYLVRFVVIIVTVE